MSLTGAFRGVLALLILPFASLAQTTGPAPLSKNPQRLETVADLWGRVYLFHPAIPSQGIDWEAAFVKALPSLEQASSTAEFAKALNEQLLSGLNDPAVFVHRRETTKIEVPPAASQRLSEKLGYLDLRNPSTVTGANALKSAVASLGAIDSLILDLRWVMPDDSDPPSVDWLREFLLAPAQVGPVVNRVHEGWNEFNTPSHYQQRWFVRSPRLIPAPDEPIRLKLVVLVNNKSYYVAEQYLDALQSGSRAAVVWEQTANFLEGPYGPRRGVVQYGENLEFHLPHLSLVSHTGVLRVHPDLIVPTAIPHENLAQVAGAVLTGASPAKPGPAFSYQMRLGGPPRAVMANLSAGERLLGLIKIWNVVRYLCPNLDLASTDWRKYLHDWAAKVVAASSLAEYYATLNESVTPLNDGHVMVSHDLIRRTGAVGTPPYRLAKVEGAVIVAAVVSGKDTGALQIGDEVLSIDGRPVADIEAERRKQESVSTPDALYRFWYLATAGPRDQPAVFEIRRSGGIQRISVERSLPNFGGRPPTWQETSPVKDISADIGYIHLGTIRSEAAFFEAFSRMRDKRGLVLDLRGNNTLGVAEWIAARLSPIPFPIGNGETPLVSSHDPLARGGIRHPAMVAPSPDRFTGKVVALIETGPQSASETRVGMLKSTGRVTLVGTHTTGTNGEVTRIYLPGGGRMQMTGQRALFPDGSVFQGVGYKPDVVAEPTIKGIMAGRDEVLEKGIETVRTLMQHAER